MTPFVETTNYLLALGTMVLQAGAVVLIFIYRSSTLTHLRVYVERWVLFVTFLLATAGLVLTLVYSEVFGFVPCGLCWLERIFLYPIALLSGIALFKRDFGIADYIMSLSFVGGIIALYHHYIQMGGTELFVCPTAGEGVSCAKRIIFEFGYITFPLMALSLFVLILVLMLFIRKKV